MIDRLAIARAYEKALFANDMDAAGRTFTDDVAYWVAGARPIGGEWCGRETVLRAIAGREEDSTARSGQHNSITYGADPNEF